MTGALALGVIIGMIIELTIDAGTIRDLQDENSRLKMTVAQLENEPKIERVEIVDNRSSKEVKFGGF